MADEHKSAQDAGQEIPEPAETGAEEAPAGLNEQDITEPAEKEAGEAAAEKIADDAVNPELFAALDAEYGDDAPDITAEKSAFSDKADVFRQKAAGFAGKLKEKAGQLSEDLKKSGEAKKKAKQKEKQRSFEEELADLAEEESSSTNGAERSGKSGNSAAAKRAAVSPVRSFC